MAKQQLRRRRSFQLLLQYYDVLVEGRIEPSSSQAASPCRDHGLRQRGITLSDNSGVPVVLLNLINSVLRVFKKLSQYIWVSFLQLILVNILLEGIPLFKYSSFLISIANEMGSLYCSKKSGVRRWMYIFVYSSSIYVSCLSTSLLRKAKYCDKQPKSL